MRNHIANICHDCLPLFNHFCLVIPQHLTLQQQQQQKRAFNKDKTVTYVWVDWLLVLKAGSFPFSKDFVAQHRSQL